MNCPTCDHPLTFAIYAICTRCQVAMQPHELQGAINAARRERQRELSKRVERDIRGMSDEQYWDAMADAQSY